MAKVRIFSTPSCVYCKTLKGYMASHGIVFEDIDVSSNDAMLDEMIEKSGQMSVPVVDIDGNFIVGFDKNKINELLNIKE